MPSTHELAAGDQAPDFTLPSSSGKSVKLSGLRGKSVVLYFYPKDDTPGCTKEACTFRDNLPKFGEMDAVILGVSKDSLDSHADFIKKYGLNFTLLSDEDLKVNKLYGTWVEKENYGRKYWGTERSTFVIGKDGKIRNVFRKVKVDGHEQDVLQALS
ncbi:MAG TPA: thioredoxin-dependent thiol peroxidase [Nitrososphaerales archaeon]|nr:thioredoxin-dependent thiol peroxidase [Nitrososphaerales archaeon]